MVRRILILVAMVGWVVGCARGPAGRQAACLPCAADEHPEAPQTLDDLDLMQHLAGQATRLMNTRKTVRMSALVEQLSRQRCRLSLPSPEKQTHSPAELYAQARDSVLVFAGLYKCDKCNNWHTWVASGFVIGASGAAVTNYHVVAAPNRESLVAMTADRRVIPVKAVLAASKADDIAIVQLDAAGLRPIPLAADAPVGTEVCVISHPANRFYMLTSGVVSRYHKALGGGAQSQRMCITADYAKGSSGAPVLDRHGSAVGLVASTFSIYYDEKNGQPNNLQMVIKECIPAASVLKLIEP